jgi:hypothetical protein
VAEASDVAKSTVTGRPLGASRETANVAGVVPPVPSMTVTSPIDRLGSASSSMIVP